MKHIPYGHRIEEGKTVIYEPEAEMVQKLFNEYIACKSMCAAGKKIGLNKTHSVLGRILKNRTYLGVNAYPAIIDQCTFDEAQKIREEIAVGLKRIKEYEPQTADGYGVEFVAAAAETKYEDPYKQAEYAYGLIQEATDE